MVYVQNKKINLTNTNKHLQDIFSSNIYLELGNISYHIMERLLAYEMINIEEITDYHIQNIGVGKFDVKDVILQNYLPYMFYENLNRKNQSIQIILTYGLLRVTRENKQEFFAPLVLIPVNLYLEDHKVFIQKISKPIENTVLMKELNKILSIEQKKQLPSAERFDSLYSIDKFTLAFHHIKGCQVSLENYFTIAYLKEEEFKIDHQRFPLTRNTESYVLDQYYHESARNYYFVDPLNKRQREAVSNALAGNNFVLVGRMGTGKTTTLINILLNAIHRGKRVLYVSNMQETLSGMEQFFQTKRFENHVANLAHSFSSLLYGELAPQVKGDLASSDALMKLYKNYKFINDYEKVYYTRILDFRFVEVLTNLSLLEKQRQFLEIDDLKNLYKAEYLQVVKALNIIDESRKKIGCMKESVWREIPITNKIRDKKEILYVLKELVKTFSYLEEECKILETEFCLTGLANLALLKNRIKDVKKLDIVDIPTSWKQIGFTSFYEAKEEFNYLKGKIYELQEIEYFLNYHYNGLDKLDTKTEYFLLHGKYYTLDNHQMIDELNQNRRSILEKIERGKLMKDLFWRSVSKLRKLLHWNFSCEIQTLKEMVSFSHYFLNHQCYNTLLSIVLNHKKDEVIARVKEMKEEYKVYSSSIALFKEKYKKANIEYIEELFRIANRYPNLTREDRKILENMLSKEMRKNKEESLKRAMDEIKECYHTIQDLETLKKEYQELSGKKEVEFDYFILEIEALDSYLKGIHSKLIEHRMIKFLERFLNYSDREKSKHSGDIKIFGMFYKSYLELEKLFELLYSYGLVHNTMLFEENLTLLDEIETYLEVIYTSNDKYLNVIRHHEKEYIEMKEYLMIIDYQEKAKQIRDELQDNQKYYDLFGDLYRGSDTNINAMSRTLGNFQSYLECFQDGQALIGSLNVETHHKMMLHLDNALEIGSDINQLFKLYTKIFKDSATKYYYFEIKHAINYFEELLSYQDEIEDYLIVTKQLQVLIRYKLSKLISYIISLPREETYRISLDFQYTYLETLRQIFMEQYPFVLNTKAAEACLGLITELEADILKENEKNIFYHIRKNSSGRFSVNDISNLDYNAYIRRTKDTKHLFLTTTQILNHYVDVSLFDLVIIDDAHLLNANDYYKAMQGKQVIVSGELQLQSVVANNLISKMRYDSTIHLNYRFPSTPKRLLNHMNGLFGTIKKEYSKNYGVEVVIDKILEYVCHIYRDNPDTVINLFISYATKQRDVYEELTNIFLANGFKNFEIIEILRTKINICDLLESYLYDADINILYLEDYYDINVEYIAVNMIDNLLLCKKSLVVYDSIGYLASSTGLFVKKLRDIVYDTSELFQGVILNPVVSRIATLLKERQVEVFPTHDSLSLVVRRQDKLFGLLFFFDSINNRYEMLNDYRDYCREYQTEQIPTMIIWLLDACQSLEEVADDVIRRIEYAKTRE